MSEDDKPVLRVPEEAQYWLERGNRFAGVGNRLQALACYDRALALHPESPDAYNNRGNVLRALRRQDDALASFQQALRLRPDYAAAWCNRGDALYEANRPMEAIASYDVALRLKDDIPEAHYGRGLALAELDRPAEAVASYDAALRVRPDYAEALNNRGNALRDLRRAEEALASYDAALRHNPTRLETLNNRGLVLLNLKRHAEAAACFEKIFRFAPRFDYIRGYLLHTRLHGCDWNDYKTLTDEIAAAVARGEKATVPFAFIIHSRDAAAQLQCAHVYAARKYPAAPDPVWHGEHYRHGRIRIAYLSADFRAHATAILAAELFESHDRARFEIHALSLGTPVQDTMRERLVRAFDRFIDADTMTDREIAQWLHANEIDIAVDLKGFTQEGRPGIFAHRGAPVQVSYLGYPGTMGAPYYDYIVADSYLVSPENEAFFSERIACLPDSYQPNDRKRRIAAHTPMRAELGLPDNAFVFCCFNNNYKITPDMFGVWMRVLRRVENGVLWLLADNAVAAGNLKREAEARGVSATRLIFAPRLEQAAHLARHACADLFLDTFPCNAHTTASDALWAGLPLLTCSGETFASRVAGSLLHAAGLPELIARDLLEFEDIAVNLATAPNLLAGLRAKLKARRETCPLFDTDRYRRHLEAAYNTMYERQQRGLAPESFDVTPIA